MKKCTKSKMSKKLELDMDPEEDINVITDNLKSLCKKNVVSPDAGKTFEQLILENERFVYKMVNEEFSKYPWEIRDDLYSAGKYGLVYAATKFDAESFKTKFITYAVHWIRYYVNDAIGNIYHPIKLKQGFIYRKKKIKKCIEEFKKENDREPSIPEISALVGWTEEAVTRVLSVNGGHDFEYVSFQAGSNKTDSDGEGNLENVIDSKLVNEYLETSTSKSQFDSIEFNDYLKLLKKKLSKKEYDIFVDRYLNNYSYKDLIDKYDLKFPSAVKYNLGKAEKVFKEIYEFN